MKLSEEKLFRTEMSYSCISKQADESALFHDSCMCCLSLVVKIGELMPEI